MSTTEETTNFLSSDSEPEIAQDQPKITKVSRMVSMDGPHPKKYSNITEPTERPPDIELVLFPN